MKEGSWGQGGWGKESGGGGVGYNMVPMGYNMYDVAVLALSLSLSLLSLSCSLVKHVQQYGCDALYDAKLGDAPTCWPWPAQLSPLWVVLAVVCVLLLTWLMV